MALNCTPKFTIFTSSVKFYAQHSAGCGQKSGRFEIMKLQQEAVILDGFSK